MTEFDKAKVIYTYLGENVEYVNDDSKDQEKVIMKTHYLYDAVCKKKTNCDGFANTFSLLCSMNGIKNFEKMDNPPKDEVGHTWNAAFLDGKWYNIDATASSEVLKEDWRKDLYSGFAFSDKAQPQKHIFTKIVPECNVDTIFIGCTLNSSDEDGAVRKVSEAFSSTDEYIFVVIIEDEKTTDEEINALMQGVADYRHTNFDIVTCDGADKKLVYINK